GYLQPQHGNRGTPHAAGAFARKVPYLARSLATRKGTVVGSSDQEWCHARPRREGNGTFSDHGRFARGRLRGPDHGSVSAPDSKTFTRGRVHHAGTIQLLRRYCAQKRISPCRLWPAGSQFLSRGRLSSGGAPMTKTERDPLAQIRSQTAAVIPAYQDEKHIGDIVRRTRKQLDHVIVVDDGSSDETAQRAREAGAE